MVIPGEMWLTTMQGSLTGTAPSAAAAPSAAPASPTANLVGNIQFQGKAFDHTVLALWLNRLEEVEGWANPWISSSSKSTLEEVEIVDFTGSVDLSTDATVDGRPQ
jgi:hypothetical protein